MGVSKNRGTPKSSILIGFSIINHPFWGTIIFGNTHMQVRQVLGIIISSNVSGTKFHHPSLSCQTSGMNVDFSGAKKGSHELQVVTSYSTNQLYATPKLKTTLSYAYHPWDERYIYLHEWCFFNGKCRLNMPYMDAMGYFRHS